MYVRQNLSADIIKATGTDCQVDAMFADKVFSGYIWQDLQETSNNSPDTLPNTFQVTCGILLVDNSLVRTLT